LGTAGPLVARAWSLPSGPEQERADVIDFLTMHPDVRREIVRVLGEIDASDT